MGLPIGTVCLVKDVYQHPLAGQIVVTRTLLQGMHWWDRDAQGNDVPRYCPAYEVDCERSPAPVPHAWTALPEELLPLAPPGDPDREPVPPKRTWQAERDMIRDWACREAVRTFREHLKKALEQQ